MQNQQLYIGAKARPGPQTDPIKKAGFSFYEAVIIEQDDWDLLEKEANQGLYPTSVDIKGKQRDQRWSEVSQRLSLLRDLGKSSGLGWVYVLSNPFENELEVLRKLKYENKAIEVLPATSPSPLEAKCVYPFDLIHKARSAEAKVLVDICHLFQTAVFQQSLARPLDVFFIGEQYSTKIPKSAIEWYSNAFNTIFESGTLAQYVHNNGHVFVADQELPKLNEPDTRYKLADGTPLKAFFDKELTQEDFGGKENYEYLSYHVLVKIGGEMKIATWFKSHTYIHEEDDMFKVLDPKFVTKQLIDANVKVMILETNDKKTEKLERDAQLFL